MAYDSFDTLLQRAQLWAQQAHEQGWISDEIKENLQSENLRAPPGLFDNQETRPLIVAFMGGTGVGKSTLLNRLAGKAIATAGIERPTSKEVTLYHHEALQIEQLPQQLPLNKIKIARHADLRYQHLLWMDMPDFDSTEQTNQHLVLDWLPFIDVLIYVVSPERYRDNKAWRLLLAEGARHAWVFVFNQWDRGFTEQLEDFKRQLLQADFINPIVFKTDCSGTMNDEFEALQKTLTSLASKHTVEQLELRARQQRQFALQSALKTTVAAMHQPAAIDALLKKWSTIWQQTSEVLHRAFAWPIKQQVDAISDALARPQLELWDEWSQSRLDDALDEVILEADNLGLASQPIKRLLSEIRPKAAKIIATHIGQELSQALANPGNRLQRGLLKFGIFCEVVLPISAMAWVSYQLLQGYYESNLTHRDYLGIDFAVHSSLLIALSWLIPFFVRKNLQPSVYKAATKGLTLGLSKGLTQLDFEVLNGLTKFREQQVLFLCEAEQIMTTCHTLSGAAPIKIDDPDLQRMLTDSR